MSSEYITKVFINEEESGDKSNWIITQDGEVLIPTNELKGGDKVILNIDQIRDDYTEACFLSIFNEERYKDVSIISEIEFSKGISEYKQNFELISRAVSRWNKNFIADEYYAFGLKDSRAYLAKVSYHEEGDNSFAYKQLLNIGTEEEQLLYFRQLDSDSQQKLSLSEYKFEYNVKYKFKSVLKGNYASFYVKKLSSNAFIEETYDWIPLFENINIKQTKAEISIRDSELERTIHTPEPITTISDKGFYGISVPKSLIKIYRLHVKTYDKLEDKLYNDIEYNKEVATEFSETYKNKKPIKLASSDSLNENSLNTKEVYNIKDNTFPLHINLKKEDITSVQVNNIKLEKNVDYVDEFIEVNNTLGELYESSELGVYVDPEHKDIIGQKDEFIDLGKGDGISQKYKLDDLPVEKLKFYPNAEIADVMVEFDDKYIRNSLDKVGLKVDNDKFISKSSLMDNFANRKFYVELTYRNKKMVVDMGAITSGKFVYDFHPEFLKTSDSYDALWRYRLAEWIDVFYEKNKQVWIDGVIRTEWKSKDSIGYVIATSDPEDIITLIDSNYDSEYELLTNIPTNLQNILKNGMDKDHVKNLLNVFKLDVKISRFIKWSLDKTTRLKEQLNILSDTTYLDHEDKPVDYFDYILDEEDKEYFTFRDRWLEFYIYNTQLGLYTDRKFYFSLFEDEYNVEDNIVTIYNTPKANKAIKLRMLYDTTYTLTDDYNKSDTYYMVSDDIKKLRTITDHSKGIEDIYLGIDLDKLGIMEYDGIHYVSIPKKLQNDNLVADIDMCGPYFREDADIKRNVRVPLRKVKDLLASGISKNKLGETFNGINRNKDFINDKDEFTSGDRNLGDFTYPRMFPTQDDIPVIEGDNISLTTIIQAISSGRDKTNFFEKLLDEHAPSYLIDRYLDVSSWFNPEDTILSPFYKKVIENISRVKSSYRVYGDRNTTFMDPYNLTEWFDGFYTGKLTNLKANTNPSITGYSSIFETIVPNINGSSISGTPWGENNSRWDMLKQLEFTLDSKFEDYDLYYLDLAEQFKYNISTVTSITGGYLDSSSYPISGNERIVSNPEIGSVLDTFYNIIYPDGYINYTPDTEYPDNTVEAMELYYSDITITNISRVLEKKVDLDWNYDYSILLKDSSKFKQNGVTISSEFEYNPSIYENADNFPTYITQRLVLGEIDTTTEQKFPNPNVYYRSNVDRSTVKHIWADNFISDEYDIMSIDEHKVQFELNTNNISDNLDCSVTYKISNYLDVFVYNTFYDNFSTTRDIKWSTLTRDRFGFSRTKNTIGGFVVNSSILIGETVYKKKAGSSNVTTGGTTKASKLIRGYTIGDEKEDVIEMINMKRNNNFEVSLDIFYDPEETKDDMVSGIIVRGEFNFIGDKQYLSNYYAVTMNFEGNNIALISRKLVDGGYEDSEVLVTVSDISSIMKRGVYYTLKVVVIKDVLKVYLNERNQEEKFYFSYNLKQGNNNVGIQEIISDLRDGLGVTAKAPSYYIDGDRIGIFSRGSKTYFMNFKLKAYEYNNLRFKNAYEYKSYDSIISTLKNTHNIGGIFKKFRKTVNGYEYLLIGESLFGRRLDGEFQMHHYMVSDFEILDNYVYVVEKLSEDSKNVINVYTKVFRVINNFIVDGTQFVNEPFLSYLKDINAEVVSIKKENEMLFITNTIGEQTPVTWDEMIYPWDTYTDSWDTYG